MFCFKAQYVHFSLYMYVYKVYSLPLAQEIKERTRKEIAIKERKVRLTN